MVYYSYDTFENDTKKLIEAVRVYRPDAIVAIARGGMMMGQVMGYGLNVRNVQTLHVESYDDVCQRESVDIFGTCALESAERILIVDDIVDSGNTLHAVLEYFQKGYPDKVFKTAALFYKSSALLQPDFGLHEAKECIDFFWEVDFH